jgi:hypothetical protein
VKRTVVTKCPDHAVSFVAATFDGAKSEIKARITILKEVGGVKESSENSRRVSVADRRQLSRNELRAMGAE